MEHLIKQHNITWDEWIIAVEKQPIDNTIKFKDLINNTIITAKQ